MSRMRECAAKRGVTEAIGRCRLIEHPRETSRSEDGRDRGRGEAAAAEDPPRGSRQSRGRAFGAWRRGRRAVSAALGGEI